MIFFCLKREAMDRDFECRAVAPQGREGSKVLKAPESLW